MPQTLLGNRHLIRALNSSIVLNAIKNMGPIDRAEIARVIKLSPATVTGITAEFIQKGLVLEKEVGVSRGGRPPILLELNPRGGFVVGVKLTETHALGALTDLKANILARESLNLTDRSYQSAVSIIGQLTRGLLTQTSISPEKLIGIGIGLAGFVDFKHGILRKSPFFGWNNLPLRSLLEAEINVPVFVDNDVNTLTLAEMWFGSGQGLDNFCTITVGRGIGMGLVTNNHFYRGAGGGAGEFGHTVIDAKGPLCDCGKKGCLETYVSYPALIRATNEAHAAGKLTHVVRDEDELIALSTRSLPAVNAVLGNAGRILGRSIANVINILNPERILISGEGVALGDPFFSPMLEAARENSLPELFSDCEIRVEPWGEDQWARGAASLVLRDLFESPVHDKPTPG